MVVTLKEICANIVSVEEGLYSGYVSFVDDEEFSAVRPGHPGELLDEALSQISWDVYADREVSPDRVRALREELAQLSERLEIHELRGALRDLDGYLQEQETDG